MTRGTIVAFRPRLPVTHTVVGRLPGLVERSPDLTARDLIHVATCLEEGVHTVIRPDRGFDSVREVRRLEPSPAPGRKA